MPGTHTKEVHESFQIEMPTDDNTTSPKDQLLQTKDSVVGVLPKGCCGIFDSRLLHAGTANRSEQSRAIFYISFKNPKLGYPGNPASIRPDLSGKLTLCQLQKELKSIHQGNGSLALEALASKQI
jgi:ectoine hydroxylase-related dioxygenase (phytanoyl-CoA dioxygenase family)